ncbi:MAG: FHA domain-containing protein [Actinomycetota bacterium]|nr:zinc-ribbon and FHA domain-containing protein [Actinomycetota bacterium]
MYCTKCGHKNPDGAKFCAFCGSVLSAEDVTLTLAMDPDTELEEEVVDPLEDLEPGQAVLIVKRGPNAGSKFLLDKDVTTAGRHPESDIFLNDVTVSRRHVNVHREGGRYLVKDTGSLNGSYLNRERVEVAELENGDELQIGKFKLMFFAAPER